MTVYVKRLTHVHEGMGPGFPDIVVDDGFDIRDSPFEGATPVKVKTHYDEPDDPLEDDGG